MPAVTQLLGLDIGGKTSGVARASSVAKLAEPLMSLPTDELIDFLIHFAKQQPLEAVVVGLPRNLSGAETAQSKTTRDWVGQHRRQLSAKLFWQDETLSSLEARRRASGADEHAGAAAVILQDFLDSAESAKVRVE